MVNQHQFGEVLVSEVWINGKIRLYRERSAFRDRYRLAQLNSPPREAVGQRHPHRDRAIGPGPQPGYELRVGGDLLAELRREARPAFEF